MSKLTIILGAGFSYLAGLPLGKDIQARFDRDLRGKLLLASSSEWMWVDGKSDAEINNGMLNHDYMAYSYIFNELVNEYKEVKGSFIDYEDFYHFANTILNNIPNREQLFERAEKAFLIDNPTYTKDNYHLYAFQNPQYGKVKDIFNYLIWDLLQIRIKKSDEKEFTNNYQPFIDLIKKYDEIDIFTLNHDLLIEFLFEENGIEYTKGFSKIGSNIQYEGEPLPTFQNDFNNCSVRLYKMHGSLDFNEFEHSFQKGNFLQITDKGTYFIPSGYRAKHMPNRINVKTGEIIQDYNPDVVPKFITGKNKMSIINQDYMYADLYKRFKKVMKSTDHLFISGYSFRDNHINKELKNVKAANILNQNPSTQYPFSQKHINIKSFNQLPSIL